MLGVLVIYLFTMYVSIRLVTYKRNFSYPTQKVICLPIIIKTAMCIIQVKVEGMCPWLDADESITLFKAKAQLATISQMMFILAFLFVISGYRLSREHLTRQQLKAMGSILMLQYFTDTLYQN